MAKKLHWQRLASDECKVVDFELESIVNIEETKIGGEMLEKTCQTEAVTVYSLADRTMKAPNKCPVSKAHEFPRHEDQLLRAAVSGAKTCLVGHGQLNVLPQAASCFRCYDIEDIALHVYPQCTTHKVAEEEFSFVFSGVTKLKRSFENSGQKWELSSSYLTL
ncbi:hypothetical protein T265_03462 [Opisthorchis viverrini]|uniref:Uncharacterized protein n=1 Tax=Opisthorchis viverrini TaxID=6198 RepID=A0A075AHJ1_OPIVI|nr:hypothetical protein T265_03462 [Opisthorchis viverrini]KER29974.1 hypothetical protein T265_03462 [Opisthorchis viverrini]